MHNSSHSGSFSNQRNNRKKPESGFSLVELMVVVAIIGILAGVAVPKFATFQARAAQTEAKSVLNGLYMYMESWAAANNGFYPTNLNNADPAAATSGIGFQLSNPNANQLRYLYRVTSNDGQGRTWAAMASARQTRSPGGVDHVRINGLKNLCTVYDSVANLPGQRANCPQISAAAPTAPLAPSLVAGPGTGTTPGDFP